MIAGSDSGTTLAGLPIEVWVSAGAGLLGALVGGLAALFGSWFEARDARALARDSRIEEAVAAVVGDLWGLMATNAPDGLKPTNEFLENLSMLQRVSWAQALTKRAEPEVAAILLDFGNSFSGTRPIGETRVIAAGTSAALIHWRSEPDKFKKQGWTLEDYVAEAAQQLGAVPLPDEDNERA